MGEDAVEASFERELRDLLTAFGDGEEVSGEWTIPSVPDPIPDWRMTVERDGEERTTARRGWPREGDDEERMVVRRR